MASQRLFVFISTDRSVTSTTRQLVDTPEINTPGKQFALEMVEEYDKRIAAALKDRIDGIVPINNHMHIEMLIQGANKYRQGLNMPLIVFKPTWKE